MTRIVGTIVALAVWAAAIRGVYAWSTSGSGWAMVNAVVVGGFGLAALVPVLLWLWRDR